jgi:histidinol phosphatase-like enzyme (inositol monophosphatase family)
MHEFVPFAQMLARESSRIIMEYFRTELRVEAKSDDSPVTIADKKAEERIRELIMKNYPGHGILGEEFGLHQEGADYCWVLDPIDGTQSFISGVPLFGTLIALTHKEEPVLGLVNFPALQQSLLGDGKQTMLNGQPVKVRACSELSDALMLTTDIQNIERYRKIKPFNELSHQVRLTRTWGDCYGYFLLATGYADIMVDPIMSPWDAQALIPVIRGAGGVITDYYGNDPVHGDSIIAAAPGLHKQVVDRLNE